MSPSRRGWIVARWIGAAVLSALWASAGAAPLSVGAGKAAIDIRADMLPLQHFGSIHDPLQARVVIIDNGAGRFVLLDIDLTAIFEQHVEALQGILASSAHTDAAHVWICASHTFSAPHAPQIGSPGPFSGNTPEEKQQGADYRNAVDAAVAQAAAAALNNLQPATFGFGRGHSDLNVSRNMPTAEGWWQGTDEQEYSDHSLGVLRFDDQNHHPIAILMNYAAEPFIMARTLINGSMPITSDLGGAAAAYIEGQYGEGTVAMYLVGAAGDQSPAYTALQNSVDKDGHVTTTDLGEKAWPLLEVQGKRLGAEAVQVSQHINANAQLAPLRAISASVPLDQQDRPRELSDIHPTHDYHFNVTGKASAPYFIVQLGDVALVGVQPELSAITGAYIKEKSPFKNTFVMTMVNGGAKYLPEAAAYKRITYQAMNASYGAGSAEILADHILQSLRSLREGSGH